MLQPLAFLFAWTNAKLNEIDRRETGATATEYALIVAGIAIVIFAGAGIFGDKLNAFFSNLGNSLG